MFQHVNIIDGVDVIRNKKDLKHFIDDFRTKGDRAVDDVYEYDDEMNEQHKKQMAKYSEEERKKIETDIRSWKILGGYEAIEDAIETGEVSEQDIRDRNERMSNIAHKAVTKVKQPIERGIRIPAEDIDEFMSQFAEGEMVEIPDEAGHGASGFSIDAKKARGFSRFDSDDNEDHLLFVCF